MKRIFSVYVVAAVAVGGAALAYGQSAPLEVAADSQINKVGESGPRVGPDGRLPVKSSVYIVELIDKPVATYAGGIPGLQATSPVVTGAHHLDVNAQASRQYEVYLQQRQEEFARQCDHALGRSVTPRYVYRKAFNGMAIEITEAEAEALRAIPGVARVEHEVVRYPMTDNGPLHIGAPKIWNGRGGGSQSKGEGTVVAILDSGINHDHPSFADIGGDGYDHTNPLGSGNYIPGSYCDTVDATFCNDKLIGAWDMVQSADDPGAPEDSDGHGSHTASTVAGNVVDNATVLAPTAEYTADVTGVAPHANIIAYDVCIVGCPGSALLAAVDQVVIDASALPNGIQALNYSISGGNDPYNDAVELAFLNATAAGVYVSCSAGNSGPGPETTGHNSPWVATVAAMTHKRALINTITGLSSDGSALPDIAGWGLTAGYGPAPIVHAGDFPTANGTQNDTNPAQCLDPFPPGHFSGQIVVCDRGGIARVAKGENVFAGGAGGFVLANVAANGEGISADSHVLPGTHIGFSDAEVLRDWLANNTNTMASLSGYVASVSQANADVTASFSSRGPNSAIDVIKPDLGAPGVSVMAAIATTDPTAPPEFGLLSGTSMSSPHNAGAGALVSAITDWNPYEIRSALMMTSKRTDRSFKDDGVTPADPFDVGAGRINLRRVESAGLVLSETPENFAAANPALGGSPKDLNLASMADSRCVGECSWVRTVRNVTGEPASWKLRVKGPPGAKMAVSPQGFFLNPNETQEITVYADSTSAARGWNFGELLLTPKEFGPRLHMPIAFQAVNTSLPGVLSNTVSSATGVNGDNVTYTVQISNGRLAGPIGLESSLGTNLALNVESLNATVTNGTTTEPFSFDVSTNSISWEGTLDVGGIGVAASPAPFGFFPLASLGISPFGCPSNCDDGSVTLNVPSFDYNGETYSQVIWSVNGTLEVGSASGQATSFANQNLPNPTPPNNILAPFWTDLNMGVDGDGSEWYVAVLTAGPRQFTVYEWNNIPLFGTSTAQTNYSFQIWVENGTDNIWFVYGGLNGPVSVATVGAENFDGTVGSSYYFEGIGTEPAVGTDLQVVATPGGVATLTYEAELKNCRRGGTTIANEAVVTNAGNTESALAVVECTKN